MKKHYMIILGIVFGYCTANIIACDNPKKDTIKFETIVVDTVRTIQKDTFVLNEKYVYDLICKAEIQFPKIVLKQAILETGHFSSPICKLKHNLFGFTTNNGYMNFNSFQESVNVYKIWQDNFYYDGDYYTFLDDINYAEDSNYVKTLKKIKINV